MGYLASHKAGFEQMSACCLQSYQVSSALNVHGINKAYNDGKCMVQAVGASSKSTGLDQVHFMAEELIHLH